MWPPAPWSMMPNLMFAPLMESSLRSARERRLAKQFNGGKPVGKGWNGIVDNEFLDPKAIGQGVEFVSNSLRRIGDDLRTFLFDAIFGGVRLAHEFADRLQRGKIDALAAGKVQREELQLPGKLGRQFARGGSDREQRKLGAASRRRRISGEGSFDRHRIAVEMAGIAENPLQASC